MHARNLVIILLSFYFFLISLIEHNQLKDILILDIKS